MTATLSEFVDVVELKTQRTDASVDVARTFVPAVEDAPAATGPKRRLGGVSTDDALNVAGAAVSALCTSLLLFGRVAPLSGALGFAVVTYGIFVLVFAFMSSITDTRPAVVDKVMSLLLGTAAAVAFSALASVIVFVLFKGKDVLFRSNFYTQDMSAAGPQSPLSEGGITHAIAGSLIIIGIALAITLPLGITCAVFLTETRGRLARPVRTIVDAMTALPSVVAGLFVFATVILVFGFERSGFAGALAVSLMMLPIIIRSSDVVLRLVPGNLREASAALGAPLWRTVWHVVLPTARSGLTTSVILGVARGVGETAPVLLTSGFTASLNVNPSKNPMVSLPLAAFEFVRSPQQALQQRGFATAAVLMVLVLGLFSIARVLGGRPAGQISSRQADRRARQSQRDLQRFQQKVVEPI